MRKHLCIIFLLLSGISAWAQFYSGGGDPGSIRWYTVSTQNYKFIYPQGLDSLAFTYGRLMEQYRPAMEWSSGYLPGGMYKSKTPVLLHAYSGTSNGMVAWAPKRMELHTLPDAYTSWPISWETSLVIHESRHLAQMQAGYSKYFKPFYWILGEMVPGAFAGLYPGPHLLEGDAVVAETGLSRSGRGRNGDFLNYYMSAFDNGDWRDWYQWRYGSYKKYAPSYYPLGYMTVAGARYFYSDSLFTAKYLESATRHPLRIGHLRKMLQPLTGEKTLRGSGRVIFELFHKMWNEEALEREPFIESARITPDYEWFTEFSSLLPYGKDILALMHGKLEPYILVRISGEGNVERLAPFSPYSGGLSLHGDRLYWSETIGDKRWELAATSRIRYMDLGDPKHRMHDLTTSGRLFNPKPSPSGDRLLAVEYSIKGGSALVVLSASDGAMLERIQAPDSLQFAETEWLSDKVYAVSTISDGGTGLYKVEDGELSVLLPSVPVTIRNLRKHDGLLVFGSDRTGVSEIYTLDPSSGSLNRMSSAKYGSADPCYIGETLYYTSLTSDGRHIYRADSRLDDSTDWSEYHLYPVAEALSAQEAALSKRGQPILPPDSVEFSEPKRYYKVPNIPNIHSWFYPIYVDIDDVQQTVNDIVSGRIALGAMAMFQNILGTATGTVGYSWAPDSEGKRHHAGHFKLTYTGLYPVIEISAHLNQRKAMQYLRKTYTVEDFREDVTAFGYLPQPYFYGRVRTYIPFSFSSGGWNRGLVPQLSWAITNDRYDKSEVDFTLDGSFGNKSYPRFVGYTEGANVPVQLLNASISGYTMQKRTGATEYPRFGIGGEIGFQLRPGMADMYSAGAYAYLYGYIPGFVRNQGTRLSVLYQHQFAKGVLFGENTVNATPRGFGRTNLLSVLTSSSEQVKFSVDYSVPLYFGDISFFSPVVYITHFGVKPHLDVSFFNYEGVMDGNLLSAGAEISAHLSNILWVPFDASVGVTMSFNGGGSFRKLVEQGVMTNKNRFYIAATYTLPF